MPNPVGRYVVQHRVLRRRARRRRFLWTGAELLVTAGVLGLLLVVHQLWWTNQEARQGAERQVRALERQWGSGREPSPGDSSEADPSADSGRGSGSAGGRPGRSPGGTTPRHSQAYAVLVLPRIGVRVPIAKGIDKRGVLDKGYAGHYPGTRQPGARGNFALAAHRNTHGEPFRHLDRLRRGDAVRVETASTVYTYAVDRILPQTSARDSGVLRPVPRSIVHPGYGYDIPGAYVTLTTCTPEYTSRYRLVVWGKLVSSERRG
ncbi:class E sortase [Streptomyces niveiscabiei]|uniref:class E sortase n=1 Tax=Streptomyces niveiscabiei TaxID=164115 RepID=UPI0029A145EA|nr:class E sortase [Streptomyces niveiscabiei]MDX3383591.1 class E sortase [Streptomyces niveiscabiei]